MARRASDVKVAILAATGFEQDELMGPREALRQAGLLSDIVSPEKGKIKGWCQSDWGEEIPVDVALDSADPADYDILFLPGAVMNPNGLRKNRTAEEFVGSFFEAGKPVAALCHGPWHLVDSGAQRGRRLTDYRTVRTDFQAFVDKMVAEFEAAGEAEETAVTRIDDGAEKSDTGSSPDSSFQSADPSRHQMLVWMGGSRRSS
jgi:protease I